MGTLRLPSFAPGQRRRKPAASPIDRAFGLGPGDLIRLNRFISVQMLDNLGIDNDGMLPVSAESAESCRRRVRAARVQIHRERVTAWRKHCMRGRRRRLPRPRARRRVVRRAAVKSTADPDGPGRERGAAGRIALKVYVRAVLKLYVRPNNNIAVRGGVLAVNAETVDIATREATAGDDLEQLEHDVIARFHREETTEQAARGGAARIELAAIRRICDYLRCRSTPATR